jgi:hypothetical protein
MHYSNIFVFLLLCSKACGEVESNIISHSSPSDKNLFPLCDAIQYLCYSILPETKCFVLSLICNLLLCIRIDKCKVHLQNVQKKVLMYEIHSKNFYLLNNHIAFVCEPKCQKIQEMARCMININMSIWWYVRNIEL